VPTMQGFGFVAQVSPAVQALHVPFRQTRFVPQVAPFAISVVVSMQRCVPVEQSFTPATHGFGFVEQAVPAVQAAHVPALQTWFAPHDVPFARLVVVLTQVCAPVAHDVVPATHGFGLAVQESPVVHATHVPEPLQTWFVPQVVPAVMLVVVLMHVCVPVEQSSVPATQGFGLVAHVPPAVQALHVPFKHTWFVPHDVPFGIVVVVSTHICWPVAHDVVPAKHLLGFVEQAVPAVQATHDEL